MAAAAGLDPTKLGTLVMDWPKEVSEAEARDAYGNVNGHWSRERGKLIIHLNQFTQKELEHKVIHIGRTAIDFSRQFDALPQVRSWRFEAEFNKDSEQLLRWFSSRYQELLEKYKAAHETACERIEKAIQEIERDPPKPLELHFKLLSSGGETPAWVGSSFEVVSQGNPVKINALVLATHSPLIYSQLQESGMTEASSRFELEKVKEETVRKWADYMGKPKPLQIKDDEEAWELYDIGHKFRIDYLCKRCYPQAMRYGLKKADPQGLSLSAFKDRLMSPSKEKRLSEGLGIYEDAKLRVGAIFNTYVEPILNS